MAVAAKFPDVKFEHATGYKTAPNLTTYNSRFYEGRYIIGQIAAKMSKTGVAGYIASFPIPEVVQGINSFLLGAQSVNPDFKLKVVWVNTWFDAGKEADAAKALIDQGVDIITQHTDSTGPMQVAEERGIHAFGQAFDQIQAGPKSQLTAITDTWGPYYVKRIKMVLDGTWKGGESSWDGLKDGILTMAPYTNMPDDVKTMAEETEAKIKSGELKPFTGPDHQAGRHRVAEGRRKRRRRHAARPELLRQGRRRQAAELTAEAAAPIFLGRPETGAFFAVNCPPKEWSCNHLDLAIA